MGVSARAGENIKCTKSSAVRDHMLVCDNIVPFEDFTVLGNGTNAKYFFSIKLQICLLVHGNGSQLNKLSESSPLVLFFYDVSYL